MSMVEAEIIQSRILVVDDEPVNVMILEQMLEEDGYTDVRSTTDPRDVVPLHDEIEFDLILLDIRMPHLSGIQVMNALSEKTQGDFVPILVLTAQTDDATRIDALMAGASDFLTKPFRQWEVLLRINNMLTTRLFYKKQRTRADEMEEKVRERTKEVRETQLEIIQRLGRAGEYRDNETGAHVTRMSRSCRLLALASGMSEQHAEKILYASLMHDVGKIGIRDDILLKPGKLDPAEFEIMKTHTTIGTDIIGDHPSEILEMSRRVAIGHHEKWDGSGYPRGLKGDEIPIEARIAAICDVFDALTSARPYKKAWSIERAIGLVGEEAGKHFDPRLSELFLDLIPEVLALRERYPDEEEVAE
jgi:putative two-component system response regulator